MNEEQSDNSRLKRIRDLMVSAALGGGVVGAGASALQRGASLGSTLRGGALGAGVGSLLAGGGGTVGDFIMGEPDADESHPFLKRGVVGGLVGGGALGALGGGLAASGTLGKAFAANPKLREMAQKILGKESVFFRPEENFLLRSLRDKSRNPSFAGTVAGGLGAGAITGAAASYQGFDEGMQADFIEDQKRKLRERSRS